MWVSRRSQCKSTTVAAASRHTAICSTVQSLQEFSDFFRKSSARSHERSELLQQKMGQATASHSNSGAITSMQRRRMLDLMADAPAPAGEEYPSNVRLPASITSCVLRCWSPRRFVNGCISLHASVGGSAFRLSTPQRDAVPQCTWYHRPGPDGMSQSFCSTQSD